MAIRDIMRASASQFVAPDEDIQAVIAAQTASPLVAALSSQFGLIGALIAANFNKYRIVAVTDKRILVLDAGKWSVKKARGVVIVLPRTTLLGPGTGLWHKIETPAGVLRVHRRFFKDVEAADSMINAVAQG